MRGLAALGYDVTIFTGTPNHLAETPSFRGPHFVERVDGVEICWVKTVPFVGAKSMRRILSWIHFEISLFVLRKRRFGRPDAIVASSLSLFSVLTGLVLRRRYGCRLVFEVRDIWPLTIVEEGGFSSRNPLVRALGAVERLGYEKADAIVGTMPNLGMHVAKVVGRPRPTHCIPMGIAERTLSAPEALPPGYAESYLKHERFTIGYAGTVGITNALEPFFSAAEALEQDPRFQFVLVGGGGLLAEYQRRYAHLTNLTFAPKVARGAVPNILKEFDLLYLSVHKSKVWDYGMSLNKLMDYMLAAKPVVASYDGFPSMINEAACGSFIPAGDAEALAIELKRYASASPLERERMGKRGLDWLLANRTYELLAEHYAQILFPMAAR
ncbi:MAG TPA: glycosyltransferase family 4 protein [Actinomycetota bacterium]|nr:glycosyltransferase family 4 protein [Actinomycetota bacterium]